MLVHMARRIKALLLDEQGADMVEYILVIAAIALPLAALILWFKNDISSWAKQYWLKVRGGQAEEPD